MISRADYGSQGLCQVHKNCNRALCRFEGCAVHVSKAGNGMCAKHGGSAKPTAAAVARVAARRLDREEASLRADLAATKARLAELQANDAALVEAVRVETFLHDRGCANRLASRGGDLSCPECGEVFVARTEAASRAEPVLRVDSETGIEVTNCPECGKLFPFGLAGPHGLCDECEGAEFVKVAYAAPVST